MLQTVLSGIIYWLKKKWLQMHASPLIPVSLPAVIGGVPCPEQCLILINKQEANNVKCTGTIVYITLLFISRTQIIWFTVGIWNPKNGNIRAIPMVPTIQKPNHFKLRQFCSDFKCFCNKMAVICMDFKWLGFRISDPIRNPDHLHPNLYSTIWNPD